MDWLAEVVRTQSDHVQFRKISNPAGSPLRNHYTITTYHHYINNRYRCHQNLTYQGAWPCTPFVTKLRMQTQATQAAEKSRGGPKVVLNADLFRTTGLERWLPRDNGHGISDSRQRNVENHRWFPRYLLTAKVPLRMLLTLPNIQYVVLFSRWLPELESASDTCGCKTTSALSDTDSLFIAIVSTASNLFRYIQYR